MYAYTIHLFESFKKVISILAYAQALCTAVKRNTDRERMQIKG
ncbi:hypothetical protein J699_00190 [Acinetobacter sp. 1000160]|nr:hypothetical protein J522_2127 [Acinetobacter baumannii 146457]EYT23742.1 hypothetical protein J699_00190 [Acinetobacter sp. 1000160]